MRFQVEKTFYSIVNNQISIDALQFRDTVNNISYCEYASILNVYSTTNNDILELKKFCSNLENLKPFDKQQITGANDVALITYKNNFPIFKNEETKVENTQPTNQQVVQPTETVTPQVVQPTVTEPKPTVTDPQPTVTQPQAVTQPIETTQPVEVMPQEVTTPITTEAVTEPQPVVTEPQPASNPTDDIYSSVKDITEYIEFENKILNNNSLQDDFTSIKEDINQIKNQLAQEINLNKVIEELYVKVLNKLKEFDNTEFSNDKQRLGWLYIVFIRYITDNLLIENIISPQQLKMEQNTTPITPTEEKVSEEISNEDIQNAVTNITSNLVDNHIDNLKEKVDEIIKGIQEEYTFENEETLELFRNNLIEHFNIK